MIKYRYEEEKAIILHYAEILGDQKTHDIIESGSVSNKADAVHLSEFFWKMVDQSVEDIDGGVAVCGQNDLEAWNEYIMDSLRAYLRNNGYAEEWDRVSDKS